jgi:hypothetical protein
MKNPDLSEYIKAMQTPQSKLKTFDLALNRATTADRRLALAAA